MKIWLDDVRNPPDSTWTVCRTAYDAITLILRHKSGIEFISFDHDLGSPDAPNGNHVAKVIEIMVESGDLRIVPDWAVHSQNPVGRDNIQATMNSAFRKAINYQALIDMDQGF